MVNADADISEALARLSQLMQAADPAIVDEFEPDALLVGSEPGEIAAGRTAIAALFAGIFRPGRTVRWEWEFVEARRSGATAWLFAEGVAVLASADREDRLPYRLGGALIERDGVWKWQLFHGSEPKV